MSRRAKVPDFRQPVSLTCSRRGAIIDLAVTHESRSRIAASHVAALWPRLRRAVPALALPRRLPSGCLRSGPHVELHHTSHRGAPRRGGLQQRFVSPGCAGVSGSFLRDFRTGEVHAIDPGLLDLLHDLTDLTGTTAVPGHLRLSLARYQRDASAPERRGRGRQPAHEGAGHRHPACGRAAGEAAKAALAVGAAAWATIQRRTSSTSTRGACAPGKCVRPRLTGPGPRIK